VLLLRVGLPSVMMRGDRGEDRCCGLSKVGFRPVMWFVMLGSAKDRVLGVDTPGQQVLARVRYGMACLLIRDVVGSVPCSDQREIGIVTCPSSHGARGAVVPRLPRKPEQCYGPAYYFGKAWHTTYSKPL
jgi:hypothetical protein